MSERNETILLCESAAWRDTPYGMFVTRLDKADNSVWEELTIHTDEMPDLLERITRFLSAQRLEPSRCVPHAVIDERFDGSIAGVTLEFCDPKKDEAVYSLFIARSLLDESIATLQDARSGIASLEAKDG